MIIEMSRSEIDLSIIYKTSKEVEKETGISHTSLNRHVKEGFIDSYKFKGKLFFKPDDVERYKLFLNTGLFRSNG